jgi:hypothetical protein
MLRSTWVSTLSFLFAALTSPPAANTQTSQAPPSVLPLVLNSAAKGPLRPIVLSDTTDSVPRRIRPSHWKEGALIGGLAVGAGLAFLVYGLCDAGSESETDCSGAPVAGFLVGAIMGSITGALIGGQFPKGEEPSDPDRPDE